MRVLARVAQVVVPLVGILLLLRLAGILTTGPGSAVLLLSLEGMFWLAALIGAAAAVRRFRRERRAGLDGWSALEEGLFLLLPRPVARIIVIEPRSYYALIRWLSRRRPRGPHVFSYHSRSMLGVAVLFLLFVTPFEAIIPILLIPWGWLRWLLLGIDLYTLLFLASLHASLVVFPHRLDEAGMRVRFGGIAEGYLAYDDIAAVRREQRSPGGRDGLQVKDGAAYLGIGGQTDVAIELRDPIRLQGLRGRCTPVMAVHIAADDPAALVRALERRLTAPSPIPEPRYS